MTFGPCGFEGLFFDIVKKKKGKRGRRWSCGLTEMLDEQTYDGCTFSREDYTFSGGFRAAFEDGVVFLVKRKCAFSDHVMIKLESLILAQNERWRQA